MQSKTSNSVWFREPPLDERFAAATGRVRVLEDSMLNAEDLRRLSDPSAGFAQRAELLEKAGYGGEGTLESRVIEGRDRQDLLLKELTIDTVLGTFLLLDQDYHNAKAIVRYIRLRQSEMDEVSTRVHSADDSSQGGSTTETLPAKLHNLIRETAPTPPEKLFELLLHMINEGATTEAPPGMRPLFYEHLRRIVAQIGTNSDLVTTDLLADKLWFAEMIAIAGARETGKMRPFLTDYISILADSANFETFFRLRRSRGSKSFLASALVPGGTTLPETFVEHFYAESQALVPLWQRSLLADVAADLPEYSDSEDIWSYGLNADLVLLKLAAKGKESTAGAEAITGFWLGKRLEAKNIRIVLQAIARGLDGDEIRKLLRPAYKGYRL